MSIAFFTSSPYFIQLTGVANQVLLSQSPNSSKQWSQYQQRNQLIFKWEGFLGIFSWDLPHFLDVLVISQMHDPYRWDIVGKGKEQAFHCCQIQCSGWGADRDMIDQTQCSKLFFAHVYIMHSTLLKDGQLSILIKVRYMLIASQDVNRLSDFHLNWTVIECDTCSLSVATTTDYTYSNIVYLLPSL